MSLAQAMTSSGRMRRPGRRNPKALEERVGVGEAAGRTAALSAANQGATQSRPRPEGTSHDPRSALRTRRLPIPAILLIALISTALAVTTSGAHDTHAAGTHHETHVGGHDRAAAAHTLTAREVAFHDAMRKLWEDHITWTRLAIISFAGGLPDLQATEARLVANQVDIGDAIKHFYDATAGNRLTGLLKEYVLGAVTLLQSEVRRRRSSRQGELGVVCQRQRDRRLPARRQSARLAAGRDAGDDEDPPRSDPQGGQDRLGGRYAADVRDYDAIHRHILATADELSAGIMHQFPRRFR